MHIHSFVLSTYHDPIFISLENVLIIFNLMIKFDLVLIFVGSHTDKIIDFKKGSSNVGHSIYKTWDAFSQKGLAKSVTETVTVFS